MTTNKSAPVAEPASEQTCPACLGDGDMLVMNGRGPDTYETIEPCSTCGGTGAVPAPAVDERTAPASDKDMVVYQSIADKYAGHLAAASNGSTGGAVVYPPDGTASPFTVINLGSGAVRMGDAIHDGRLPALWFGTGGEGMGHEAAMNRAAHDGETIAVVTFANVDGLDVLLDVIERCRRVAFPGAPARSAATSPEADGQMKKD